MAEACQSEALAALAKLVPEPAAAPVIPICCAAGGAVAAATTDPVEVDPIIFGDSDYVPWSALVLGDSWFSSVKTAVAHGKLKAHYIGNVKGSHASYPKDLLLGLLKDMPGGSKLSMKMTKEGIDLIATGYKYNSSKVIFFIMTEGAGSTKSGTSYFSKFQDGEGNVVSRAVDARCLHRASTATRRRWTTTTRRARPSSGWRRSGRPMTAGSDSSPQSSA